MPLTFHAKERKLVSVAQFGGQLYHCRGKLYLRLLTFPGTMQLQLGVAAANILIVISFDNVDKVGFCRQT